MEIPNTKNPQRKNNIENPQKAETMPMPAVFSYPIGTEQFLLHKGNNALVSGTCE